MNPSFLLIAAAILALALIVMWVCRHRQTHFRAANALPEPLRSGAVITKKATAALATRHLLVKFDTDTDYVVVNTIGVVPLGSCLDEPAAGDPCNVQRLGNGDTMFVQSDGTGAIAVGDLIYTAASGQVSTTSTNAKLIGRALTAATATAGAIVEIETTLKLA